MDIIKAALAVTFLMFVLQGAQYVRFYENYVVRSVHNCLTHYSQYGPISVAECRYWWDVPKPGIF